MGLLRDTEKKTESTILQVQGLGFQDSEFRGQGLGFKI